MFGLFKKNVKLVNLAGRNGQVNAKLSNGNVVSCDITKTQVDEFLDLLIQKGLDLAEANSAKSMYQRYVDAFNPAGETYVAPTTITSESLLNEKMADINRLLSGVGSKPEPDPTATEVKETPANTVETVVAVEAVKEKSDVSVINAISVNRNNVCDGDDLSSDEARATSQKETKVEQEKTTIAEEAVVVDEKIELVNVVPTPTIAINEEVIGQITRIIESDALDIMRISEVLMKAGEAGVSKDGFTFKLSDVEGDVIIEKDGAENWDMELESPEEKQRILDILKNIE